MLVKLVRPNDPVLTREAEKIVFPDPSIRPLATEMMKTMLANRGCGLAAPQVGLSIRMFVWSDGIESGVVINPAIIERGDPIDYQEGCLTFNDQMWATRRAKWVTLVYNDFDGGRIVRKFDNLAAIITQHETDHCNGIILPMHGTLIST